MCGIAGYIGADASVKQESVHSLLDFMLSRGPDAQSSALASETVLLGSNRLRITDAHNENADMPLSGGDGRYLIVFNGEIYNHSDLRQKLRDYPFKTASDTETIIAAYNKWGAKCLHHFEGMFSFCLYDKKSGKAFLAVDPTGQKPLYYCQSETGFYFASNPEALLRHADMAFHWDETGLVQAAAIMFAFGARTHIREIKKLESGCYLYVSRSGDKLFRERYYKVPVPSETRERKDARNLIRQAAEEACRRTFSLEVPYAHLLSGGIDSSLVVALARKHNLDLSTYAIGFNQPSKKPADNEEVTYNEFAFSDKVACHFGTNHNKLVLTTESYCRTLTDWSAYCCEPFGSPEAVSLFYIFSKMRERGYKVAFSGSGPDEIFDGYAHGQTLAKTDIKDIPVAYFKAFNGLGAVDLNRFLPGRKPVADFEETVLPYLELYMKDTQDPRRLVNLLDYHIIYQACEFRQIDMTSMAHSIEARSPLVDQALVRAAFSCAQDLKVANGKRKYIFGEAVRDLLPDEIIDRRKAGFPIPQSIYLSPSFESLMRPYLEDGTALDSLGLFDMAYLRSLWDKPEPSTRSVFFRLYMMARIAERQSEFMS